MRARTREVRTSVSTSREHSLVCAETMKSAVFHVERHDTDALAFVHNQVEREELDKEVGVMLERLTIEVVQDSMACTVGGGSAAVGLPALSEFEGLTAKSALVDFTFFCTREGNTESLELQSEGLVMLDRDRAGMGRTS